MAKRATSRKHRMIWFKAIRGSYLPCSPAGWLTYIPFAIYLVGAPLAAFSATHSLTLTALFAVPNWVAATAAMTWLAKQTS